MALGSLVVRLGLDAAEFTGGMTKAEYQAKRFVENTTANIGKLAGLFTLAGGAAAGALAVMDRAANTVAVYKGLSEEMGATASAVSSLQKAADLSGVALDTVAKASVRLTSTLSKSDEGSKDTAAALAAINVPIKEFRDLDPVSQLERVAQQLSKFEDGAGKTAVAVQLFGKAGAELIPFFNDLAEAGERQIRLTDEQIEAADQYTKQIARLKSEFSELSQGIIADVIPSFSKILDQLNAIRKGSLFGWLSTSGEEEGNPGKRIAEIDRMLESIRKQKEDFGKANSIAQWWSSSDLKGWDAQIKLLEKQRAYLLDLKRAQDVKSVEGIGDLDPMPPKQLLNFRLKDDDKKAIDKASAADRYIESLKRTEAQLANLTDYEQLMWDLEEGRLKGITPKQLEYASVLAKSNDATREQLEDQKLVQAVLDDLTRTQKAQEEQAKRTNESLEKQASAWLDLADPMRKFIRELEEIDALVSKGFLSADQAKSIKSAMGEHVEKQGDDLDQYAINAAKSMQSAFADFLFDPFKDGIEGMASNFGKIVQRMIAEAAAAQLIRSLLGDDFTKTGNVGAGSWIGMLIGAKADGGPVAANTPYLVGERGPELFMPKSAGTIVPNHAMGGGITINNTYHVAPAASRADMVRASEATRQRTMADVADALRRGNL